MVHRSVYVIVCVSRYVKKSIIKDTTVQDIEAAVVIIMTIFMWTYYAEDSICSSSP